MFLLVRAALETQLKPRVKLLHFNTMLQILLPCLPSKKLVQEPMKL